jgi:hypothetical protein
MRKWYHHVGSLERVEIMAVQQRYLLSKGPVCHEEKNWVMYIFILSFLLNKLFGCCFFIETRV